MKGLFEDTGRIFTVTQIATASTGGTDALTVLSTLTAEVELLALDVVQQTTAPQTLPIELWRFSSASTGPATPGAAITPVNRNGWPTAQVAVTGVTGNTTTPTSTAAGARLHAGACEADSGAFYWAPQYPPNLNNSGQRFAVRFGVAAVVVPVAVTLTFREAARQAST